MRFFLVFLIAMFFTYLRCLDVNEICREIIPLNSNCKNVMQVLNVKECNIPLSTYKGDVPFFVKTPDGLAL